ncbi:histidine kinase N-terminal 7TM domain-containing protein [Paenibacillus sacheonensis]|uniref:histidine kinase n=1 Tax=Paenibacillus sacheonensis TaxID=742054 RepID=A0A7X4YSQ4_9BACL|nr:histidine kinase N-terminal 7TM domain-containing protein [Paenibacillus sacheonensis]MBM7568155.1 signal transduction histidine kinase [Paenibacillus sacheonensis]NBC71843.1 PAS domain-containing protein [Paenibacillus sacheonensis]
MSTLLFIAAALMAFVALLSYRRRHLPVARTMVLMMLAGAFYALGYGMEVLARSLEQVKLALQIEYIGIPFVTTLWLYQAIQFTGTAERSRRKLAFLLFLFPTLLFVLHFTNDWHHLVYASYSFNGDGSVPLYTTVKGIGYNLHALYSYLVLAGGIGLFVAMYVRALPAIRKQILILLLGAFAPMAFNLLFWFGVEIDFTPFGFAVSGIAYAWGILRFNLLRLTPLALAKVFETIREGVLLLDGEGRIVSYNGAAARIFPELGSVPKYPAPAGGILTGHPSLLRLIAADSVDDERFPFRRQLDGRTQHYSCSLSIIYDAGTMPVGKMIMFNDITELIENEARLRENARQLSELNAFKDKLFTVVAHDIRDPIALLVSLTDLLGDELTAADIEHADVFVELQGQVQSTYHLVDNLLDWYRSQKGAVAFRPSGWNARQVVLQAMSLASSKAGMKSIRITERIDASLAVDADKEMLDLILRNLLSNAIKFTGIGGEIEIGAATEGDRIAVFVRDNGAGIDDKTSEMLRLEEPFSRAPVGGDSGDTRFGLALAREFVRIHGGALRFESEPGTGTTFTFTLPRADARRRFGEGEEHDDESHIG